MASLRFLNLSGAAFCAKQGETRQNNMINARKNFISYLRLEYSIFSEKNNCLFICNLAFLFVICYFLFVIFYLL